ncbi:ferrous iron transport protein A [Cetobacterium ceti]|uniref:Ferrous iron transport protein A n=1 Tax=Cetobacterium ceti TaxID=180163 RepID=A0A1T4JUZ9_9FUSO|nr:FeoA family protein [Cetobacterium ceti]SJZ33996.1 ferrous iron transport protein A [Cetobacterium ceti]
MLVPLAFVEHNRNFIIKEIRGNSTDKNRLIEKGFCIGNNICLVKDDNNNFIVKINESKYVINFSLANKILLGDC